MTGVQGDVSNENVCPSMVIEEPLLMSFAKRLSKISTWVSFVWIVQAHGSNPRSTSSLYSTGRFPFFFGSTAYVGILAGEK